MVKLKPEPQVPQGLLADFSAAVAEHQPELAVTTWTDCVVLTGNLVVSGPDGPFDAYQIQVAIPPIFPWQEPVVFEIGGRIPKIADRHVFEDNENCCLGVWEEWLFKSPDRSASSFLTGPLHDYFLSQCWYEATSEWPFGDRSHGSLGVLEGFCDLLGITVDRQQAVSHLKLLARENIKGHVACPCGSGKRLRNCHIIKFTDLREWMLPFMAQRMLDRIQG